MWYTFLRYEHTPLDSMTQPDRASVSACRSVLDSLTPAEQHLVRVYFNGNIRFAISRCRDTGADLASIRSTIRKAERLAAEARGLIPPPSPDTTTYTSPDWSDS